MWRVVSGSACLCAALGCQAFVGDYSADLEEEALLSSSELCALDSKFSFELQLDSEAAKDTLEAYYEAANPGLVEHLAAIAQKFANGEPEGGVTYLQGASGVGKSFVTSSLTGAFDDDEQCSVEFADLFAASVEARGFEVESRPDLATTNRAHVFNELPTLSAPADFDIEVLLEAIGCFDDGVLRPLVVLDGIDEIHENTARLLLERVDDYILGRDEETLRFVHFLISGRPEGFASWLTTSERSSKNTKIETQYDLTGPKYVTGGDLAFRVESYLEFALGDSFTEERLAEYTENFLDAMSQHPFLRYTTSNLAFGNLVIDQSAPGLDRSERALKARLFEGILARNVETHGRPGAGTELDGTYRRILEDIAAKYTDVDDQGRFSVASTDTVECFSDDGESLGRVRVSDVLNRSGVALLTDPRIGRYHFEPFWLHAHLVERRNQRLDARYTYETCE
ncbi:MAG TPA: hypothetical protein VI197_32125 [Polyangiaceae bacterium]